MYEELLINVTTDCILFSFIEGILYCKCYEKIFNLKKFKFYEILLLSIGNSLMSQLFPSFIYQCFMIIWMGLILAETKRTSSIFKGVLFGFFVMALQLIIEMFYAIILEFVVGVELVNFEKINLFIIIIPLRIIQTILIYGGVTMKGWLGAGTTRK